MFEQVGEGRLGGIVVADRRNPVDDLGRVSGFPAVKVEVQPDYVPPLQRAVDLHEIAERQV
jgi:hypothetical protein